MVKIPYIKIPSVRVGSIVPTSNIGTGGATPAPPTPITYLTQWQIVGNSEVHGNEIWSCGEYSEVDGKWHIRILPEGYGIADIALDEPLRMTNNNADTIEYANNVCTVTRNLAEVDLGTLIWNYNNNNRVSTRFGLPIRPNANNVYQILNNGGYTSVSGTSISSSTTQDKMIAYFTLFVSENGNGFVIRDERISSSKDARQVLSGIYAVYELATPTTETIQVPQIQEADSYSCVISQDGKAVSWSSFETE